MKSITVFAVVLCAVAFFLSNAAAVPVSDVVEAEALDGAAFDDTIAFDQAQALRRQKRATCDLLSGTGVNHSACAAHCILRGNRGGYCNSQAVCVCRN